MWRRLFERMARMFASLGSARAVTPRRYVITIAFGPVQGFIATARRTRDLWFGSCLLSEVSKAGARALCELSAANAAASALPETRDGLVFPHTEAPEVDLKQGSNFNVVNKLIGIVTTDDPRALACHVERAGIGRFETLAAECLDRFGSGNVDVKLWDLQKSDVVECYAAWAPLAADASDYKPQLGRANAMLSARKASRNFEPAAITANDEQGYRHYTSSLDGARESVLHPDIKAETRAHFDIDPREQLDCPGLIKRVLGKNESFAAITRVAAEPWVRYHVGSSDAKFRVIENTYAKLVEAGLGTNVDSYQRLRFDAQFVYSDRRRTEIRRCDAEPSRSVAKDLLVRLGEEVRACCERDATDKEPIPYVALLQADGDNMGLLIDALASASDHRKIAAALSSFAGTAPDVVKRHGGQCVYAGGEDVLALLPTDAAIPCAAELAQEFSRQLGALEVVRELVASSKDRAEHERINIPTLSVGLGVGHIMQPLSDLRAIAATAEKLAKDGVAKTDVKRNALGIIVQSRSGAALRCRANWGVHASPNAFARRLQIWIAAFHDGTLPDRLAYQVAQLARLIPNHPSALYSQVDRMIERKGDGRTPTPTRQAVEECLHVCLGLGTGVVEPGADGQSISLADLEAEWLLARWFAKHIVDASEFTRLAAQSMELAHVE